MVVGGYENGNRCFRCADARLSPARDRAAGAGEHFERVVFRDAHESVSADVQRFGAARRVFNVHEGQAHRKDAAGLAVRAAFARKDIRLGQLAGDHVRELAGVVPLAVLVLDRDEHALLDVFGSERTDCLRIIGHNYHHTLVSLEREFVLNFFHRGHGGHGESESRCASRRDLDVLRAEIESLRYQT